MCVCVCACTYIVDVCIYVYIYIYIYRLGWRRWAIGVNWLVAIARLKQANAVYVCYMYA